MKLKKLLNKYEYWPGEWIKWGITAVFLLGILLTLHPGANAASPTLYYVSPAGNDNNPGTFDKPFATIQHAVDQATPGTYIYVRGGIYTEKINITRSGEPGNPIVIAAFSGEEPIIDGVGKLPNEGTYTPLVQIKANHIIFRGFEIRNSTARGLQVFQADDVLISNVNTHHHWNVGLQVESSTNVLVEDSVVWQNIRARPEAGIIGGGGFQIRESDQVTARRNVVFNNHGEGLSPFRSTNIIVEENIIYDNRHANLYLSLDQTAVARRNLIYCTDNREFWRTGGTGTGLRAGNGLIINDETGGGWPETGNNRTVINNIVVGCGVNFAVFTQRPDAGLKGAVIAFNTFVEARGDAGSEYSNIIIMPGDHTGAIFANNLVWQSDEYIARGDGASDPDIVFSHNLYTQPVESEWLAGGGMIADPLLVNPIIINGNMTIDANWYHLLANSPARDAGVAVTGVLGDFHDLMRDDLPDIGAFEYGSTTPVSAVGLPERLYIPLLSR